MNDENPRLANAVLDLSASVSKLTVAVERLLREVREGEAAAEDRERGHVDALRRVNERLAVISKDIDDNAPTDKDPPAVKLVEALGKIRPLTLLLFGILLFLAVAGGWVKALLP